MNNIKLYDIKLYDCSNIDYKTMGYLSNECYMNFNCILQKGSSSIARIDLKNIFFDFYRLVIKSHIYYNKDTCTMYPIRHLKNGYFVKNKTVETCFEYHFCFESLEDMFEFIKYYDSVDDESNILEDFYHIIFIKNGAPKNKQSYADYLKTKHWKNIREKKIKDANNKCQLCCKTNNLHVHHRTYENIGNENNKDLVVLCQKSHSKFHNKQY